METSSSPSCCVTILLPPGVRLTADAARILLACARRHAHASPWGAADVDILPGRRGTLLVARPAGPLVSLAPWALPYLHKYFTD